MTDNSFRRDIDERLSSVKLRPALKQQILAKAREGQQAAPPRRAIPFKRTAAIAIAACLVLLLGVTVIATVFPSFERFVGVMGPDYEMTQPIVLQSVKNGIEMEVVAAINDNSEASVYLTLRDLEGDRIEEETCLYGVSLGDDSFAFAEMLHFDHETRTATYLLDCTAFADVFAGHTLELSIDGLLLGEQQHWNEPVGLSLAEVLAQNPSPRIYYPPYIESFMVGYGAANDSSRRIEQLLNDGKMPLLLRGDAGTNITVPGWVPVSSAGIVDGFLHLQLTPGEDMSYYSDVNLSLEWPGSENLYGSLSYGVAYLNDNGSKGWHNHYETYEWVMEIPRDVPLEDIQIVSNGISYSEYIPGGWSVTFQLDSDPDVLEWQVDLDVGAFVATSLRLSPLGVSLSGKGEEWRDQDLEIMVLLKNGTYAEFRGGSSSCDFEGNYEIRNDFAGLLDPACVEAVYINQQEFLAKDAA